MMDVESPKNKDSRQKKFEKRSLNYIRFLD